jgi:23S rRNA (guanosine2251-2'-O)-methyltransferase
MSQDWMYGINAVEGQLQSDSERVLELWVDAQSKNARVLEVVALAAKRGIEAKRTPAADLEKKCGSDRHQGLALKYKMAELLSESDLVRLAQKAGNSALFLVLDGVQDPHNLGACIRSAAASGATAVVFPKDKSAGLTAVAHRASAGTAAKIAIVQVTNLARALEQLKEAGVWCYGAAGETQTLIYQTDFKGPVALVLGNEGDGLRRLTRDRCDGLVKIPMSPLVESLNVSVAAGVMLFEVVRQRLTAPPASK